MRMIAEGVWQLAGWPRDLFNVYLAGDVLIDAGTRWSRRRIFRQIEDRTVRLLALTHCHPDHQGAARAVCEQLGVPLASHAADVPAVEGRAPMLPDNGWIRLARRFWSGPPHPVERVLQEGDLLAGFRVLHVPGHTPGHILFFRDSDRVAIVGDVLINMNFLTFKPHLQEPLRFFSADAAQNRRSIQILVALKPRVVCFGHGPPLWNTELLEPFAEGGK